LDNKIYRSNNFVEFSDCEGDTQEEVGGHCSGKLHLHVYPIYFCYAILIIKVGMHAIVLFC
jgi:hypothetical protein